MALTTKRYPDDYSTDVTDILSAMSFGDDMYIIGTASLRSQLYVGDYDAFETVHVRSLSDTVQKFKAIVRNLTRMKSIYVGDIKSGTVPEWDILKDVKLQKDKVVGYDRSNILASLEALKKQGIVNAQEYREARVLLKPILTSGDYFVAKEEIKFHTVRWTPSEVIQGSTTLRDGRSYTLSDAFTSPAVTKVDTISLVAGSRYSEFSVVYEFVEDGQVLNVTPNDIRRSIIESMVSYVHSGNYFKAIKRIFSLARIDGDQKTIDYLKPILNSDLGRLYIIVSDIDTLLFMLDNYNKLPAETIRFEIDQFINRLSNVSLPPLVGKQPTLNRAIRKIQTLSLSKMSGPLETLKNTLNKLLQQYSKPIADELTAGTLSGGGGGSETPKEWGPRLWHYLHTVAARHNLDDLKSAFKSVIRKTPCAVCRLHTADYLTEHPPKEPTDRYVWEFHNAINARTGKKIQPISVLSQYSTGGKV